MKYHKDTPPTISIVVPVYNVEQYLSTCLDSILAQSFADWEMLLVDDGSTDQGGTICDRYAAADPRIRVFHQENQGLSAARNTALDHASGTYVTMVDSDDIMLSRDYLSILYNNIVTHEAQISIVDFFPFSENVPSSVSDQNPRILCYNGLESYAHCAGHNGFNYGHSCGKLYDRSLFSDVRYPVDRLSEDNAIAHLLFSSAERVVIIKTPVYGYRVRPDSIMTGSSRKTLVHDIIYAFNNRMKYFEQLGHPELCSQAEQELLRIIRIVRKIDTLEE